MKVRFAFEKTHPALTAYPPVLPSTRLGEILCGSAPVQAVALLSKRHGIIINKHLSSPIRAELTKINLSHGAHFPFATRKTCNDSYQFFPCFPFTFRFPCFLRALGLSIISERVLFLIH